MRRIFLGMLVSLSILAAAWSQAARVKEIRVGYFPNITHAQALVGMATGLFQRELGLGIKIKNFLFNAGPSAMEALMAGRLDLVYVGPNPAVTCFIRTNGDALRIIAGAAGGGAGLVVRKDAGIKNPADLAGKSIATPQLGNTQDVACRYFLLQHGLKTTEFGGNVRVIPTANPDQLTLFLKKEIHGAWTIEPWVARLIGEAGGSLLIDERDLWPKGMFVTAHLVASRKFLAGSPRLVQAWLRAHVTITGRINEDPVWARRILNQEIKRYTGKALPESILADAWNRLRITYDPIGQSLHQSAKRAYELGFLGRAEPNLKNLYDLRLLNELLKELGLPPVG